MNTLTINEIRLTDSQFRQISDLVYAHCGINLHDGKKELVRARLAKRIRLGNFNSFEDYMKYITQDGSGTEFSMMIDSLSTNLTSFFREAGHFQFLREKLLPSIITRKRSSSQKIRCWSAGCSSGEEPYSIAITILDALEGLGNWDAKILASDISTSVLEKAQQGIYNSERIAPLSQQQKHRYLLTHNMHKEKMFEVTPRLKNMILFRYLNLMQDWPLKGPLDFIFCRNVMIYFDKQTQSKLVNRYWDLLDHGGILFTGHSESLTGIEHKFQYVQPTIYMKA